MYSVSRTTEASEPDVWLGSEATRSVFALTNTNTAPPVTTDSEVLTELRRGAASVSGRLRLADYMNPQDNLYFEAKRRAVSVADYDLEMRRE